MHHVPKCVTNGAAVSWESMFPLKDENPTEITPFVTVIIIAANVLVWVMVQNAGAGQEFLESLGG